MTVTVSSFFALMAEFGTAEIPLESVCDKYFGLDYKTALRRAPAQQLPVPVYKVGSQKSTWLVSAQDLAALIDKQRGEALKHHRRMKKVA